MMKMLFDHAVGLFGSAVQRLSSNVQWRRPVLAYVQRIGRLFDDVLVHQQGGTNYLEYFLPVVNRRSKRNYHRNNRERKIREKNT
jgi:hypothetical protein